MSASADISQLLRGLGRYQAQGVAAARGALDQFAQRTLDKAQEICPIEDGFLAASATMEPGKVTGTTLVGPVIGFNAKYAAARHERPPEHDAPPRQNPRGRWKFLETAVRDAAPKLGPFVAGRIRAATGG